MVFVRNTVNTIFIAVPVFLSERFDRIQPGSCFERCDWIMFEVPFIL